MSLPNWLKKRIPKSENIKQIRQLLDDSSIHTVCESALCPNIGECFSKKTVTFMILGNICTRSCNFCAVNKGTANSPDPDEPKSVAIAAAKLNLKYIVITSVTRDDLPDGGALQFALTIKEIKKLLPYSKIEVLIPDFGGNADSLKKVIDESPYVLNHNLETIGRLYRKIRPQAEYLRSLELLKNVKSINRMLYTKSGIMVGLGEKKEEVIKLMQDLKSVDCDIITIGQYLRPSKNQVAVSEFIPPELFNEYKQIGRELGFKRVIAGPFVRSSYMAGEINV